MPNHLLSASGYLMIFLPLGLLIAGQALDVPYLAAAVIFGLGPLSRLVLGNVPDELPDWNERTTTLLDRLPVVYAIAFPAFMGWFLVGLHAGRPSGPGAWMGHG